MREFVLEGLKGFLSKNSKKLLEKLRDSYSILKTRPKDWKLKKIIYLNNYHEMMEKAILITDTIRRRNKIPGMNNKIADIFIAHKNSSLAHEISNFFERKKATYIKIQNLIYCLLFSVGSKSQMSKGRQKQRSKIRREMSREMKNV